MFVYNMGHIIVPSNFCKGLRNDQTNKPSQLRQGLHKTVVDLSYVLGLEGIAARKVAPGGSLPCYYLAPLVEYSL
jgi:hypothetical protein